MTALTITAPAIKSLIKKEKFPLSNSLTEELIRSLTTKIIYTLHTKKIFSQCPGVIDLEYVTVIPYLSILGDTRFIINFPKINGLEDVSFSWNGKFKDKNWKSQKIHNILAIGNNDFDLTKNLDDFVELEKKIVDKLNHIISDEFAPVAKSGESNA